MTKNIMIVGVGGQGTLLASRVIGSAAQALGYDVKVSEVHGMSQRGGSVVTYVRYGESVASPVIEAAEADIIIAFEALEAARWLPYLKPGGKIISSAQRIAPMPVITGAAAYPEDIFAKIKAAGADITVVDALAPALEAGSSKAVNIVLLGVASRFTDIPRDVWERAVRESVPERFLDMNLRAFEAGRKIMDN